MHMLDTAVSSIFHPGINLKGHVAGSNWSFILPEMRLERIICFGAPSLRTQETISRLGDEVVFVTEGSSSPNFQPENGDHQVGFIDWKPNVNSLPDGLQNHEANLIIIFGRRMVRRISANPGLQIALLQLLSPRGLIFLELDRLIERLITQKQARQLAHNLGKCQFLWSSPFWGEINTAVPADDQVTISYFIRHHLYLPESRTNILSRARRFGLELLIKYKFTSRQSMLVSQQQDLEMRDPPEYLCALAGEAGINIRHHRWGLVAHGEYSSRKVLFYLFNSNQESPEYIVKLVRTCQYNARLENEYRALSFLWEKGLGELNFLPKPLFFGYHNRLAIFGETAIAGRSFRKMAMDQPDCPHARLAVQHITDLGTLTSMPDAISTQLAAETLMQLFETFVRIYQPNFEIQSFLEKQISSIASFQGVFPLVFQHGDPGVWNILVTPKDEVFFLDWEAAESHGIPLWDLWYFLRSYAVGLARASGVHDAMKGFEQQFLSGNPFTHFALDVLHTYCEQLALPAELVEPLFYTCWMHRALKEANRLKKTQLYKSHYYQLLVFCIQNRGNPQMASLLSVGS